MVDLDAMLGPKGCKLESNIVDRLPVKLRSPVVRLASFLWQVLVSVKQRQDALCLGRRISALCS